MQQTSNLNSVKRLQREYAAFLKSPPPDMTIYLIESSVHECHFSFKGQSETDFAEGIYHGKFVFPYDYPKNPPEVYFFTPNGRFAINTKICLSITSFHPETWTPVWSISSMLEAIRAFMLTPAAGAVGGLETCSDIKKEFAIKSQYYTCPICGANHQELKKVFMLENESGKKNSTESVEYQSKTSTTSKEVLSKLSDSDKIEHKLENVEKDNEIITEKENNNNQNQEIMKEESNVITQNEINSESKEELLTKLEDEIVKDTKEKEEEITQEDDVLTILKKRQEAEKEKIKHFLEHEEETKEENKRNEQYAVIDETINIILYLSIFLVILMVLNLLKIKIIMYFLN
ncbi:ubiquitin-conjugating enzyme family protein [Entamoeba histolytica HM-1:IMSS-B]|uniref:Ubiquitin-conjugating enzyme family protein n=5 Tax=Entamoeba histolytica TaxID=5759 RepID=C4LUH3_ENTH1|nr:ubiquitin-conjugating enzyme family protein [Entamoeba histolytica HM-1:IMSS]EAL51779.1 ubiquitin-conjugating enzyme family protein [Entamoeba histolytica HM-1:IMSS]EMH73832.1 ubiquitin-conjugating enzyme family protein [Entamoeba histolytica HM-1:IMSS-B]ENY60115.1 ubiquitin-conjugating enzyme family protein, putative [Entamoeba histolytica HM-1:IMSS-A]GAT92261.1 ubiquitin-conjugating enzyme family protein [Entamoeba histolytica]|eukprot:XP_657165.1 ubiquitin-conjugating enzyme family protein [Entamoeba histolytica HM-1:IMSS]